MLFLTTPSRSEIFRRAFKKFVAKEIVPYLEEWEEKREMPRAIWKKLGEQGYLCPWLNEEYRGTGAGFEYYVIINEELSRAGAGVGVGLYSDNIATYIYSYGNEEQSKGNGDVHA